MEKSKKSSFQFNGFRIKRSLIERKDGNISKTLNIGFLPKGKYFKASNNFELFLKVKIDDKNFKMHIEIDAIADYLLEGKFSDKDLKNYFYINAPAILFPYIRAYISTLTNLSGVMTPVVLPTLNLSNLAKALEESTEII